MTVLELSEVVNALEEEFGVTAAAPVTAAGPAAGAAAAPKRSRRLRRDPPVGRREEDRGHQGRPRVDGSRPQGGQGGVDEAPNPVKEAVTKDEAEESRKQLEAAGATVEVK